jgi:hypothetical protein
MFINDLPCVIKNAEVMLFAYDTSILITGKKPSIIKRQGSNCKETTRKLVQ